MTRKQLVFATNVVVVIFPCLAFLSRTGYPFLTAEAITYMAIFLAVGAVLGLLAARASKWIAIGITSAVVLLSADLVFNESPTERLVAAVVGLLSIVLLWKLRDNGYKIILAGFGAMIVSTVIFGASGGLDVRVYPASERPAPDNDLPIIVHIFLDEYGGLDGLPLQIDGSRAFVEETKDLYLKNGFTIFGRAISEDTVSKFSIGRMFNNDRDRDTALIDAKRNPTWMRRRVVMAKNAYFEDLSRRGYRIFVRQSDYLSFCETEDVTYARCHTYDYSDIKQIADSELPIADKLVLFISFQVDGSGMVQALYKILDTVQGAWYGLVDGPENYYYTSWYKSLFTWKRPRIGALSHPNEIAELTEDILRAGPGDMFLVHLLEPHYPYVYDASCKAKRVAEWVDRTVIDTVNTGDESLRTELYRLYFDYARCFNNQIAEMIERLRDADVLDRMIIIVQGDHGSRILRPGQDYNAADSGIMMLEHFSTFFAIRFPNGSPGYNTQPVLFRNLLWNLIANDYQQISDVPPPPPRLDFFERRYDPRT